MFIKYETVIKEKKKLKKYSDAEIERRSYDKDG